MSHIVTIKTEVRDANAVRAACRRLSLAEPVQGKTKLFSGEAEGLAVQLPDLDLSCGLQPAFWPVALSTTSMAVGATRNTLTVFSKPTRLRKPRSRPARRATRLPKLLSPMAPSS